MAARYTKFGGVGSAAPAVSLGANGGLYYNSAGQLVQGTAPNPGNQLPTLQIPNAAGTAPIGWTLNANMSYVTGNPLAGTYSLENATGGSGATATPAMVACVPGQSYYAQFFVRCGTTAAGDTASIRISYYNAAGSPLGNVVAVSITVFTTTSTQAGAQFVVPALEGGQIPSFLAAQVFLNNSGDGNTLYCDAVGLVNTIVNPYIAAQAIQAANMAANAITAANGALAALAVVSGSMASGAVNPSNGALAAGAYVFTSDVAFSRGTGQPIVYIGTQSSTAGVWLFGASASGGASGLLSSPYASIQAGTALFYGGNTGGGGTGPSLTLSGSAATFWQVNGSTSNPFLQLSASGAVISDGGTTTLTAFSGSITLLNVSASQQLSVSASGIIASGGSYVMSLSNSGGLTLSASGTNGGSVTITASGGVMIQNHAGTSYVSITASGGVAIVGGNLTNSANNVLTTLNNVVNGTLSLTVGLTTEITSGTFNGYQTLVSGLGFHAMDASSNATVAIQTSAIGDWGILSLLKPGAGRIQMDSSVPSISMSASGLAAQVLTTRQAGPGAAPSGFADSVAQAYCLALYDVLSHAAGGHGLMN